jgi:hypothetical protein
MGRKKTVEGTADSNTHTFYCAPEKWKAYQAVAGSLRIPASALLRTDIDDTIAKYNGGDFRPKFDLVNKTGERLAIKQRELKLLKLLENEVIVNRYRLKKPAFEVMQSFAVALGSDETFSKDIEAVLKKLHSYDCTEKDVFSSSTLETFIEYIEVCIERRKIEDEIRLYRRQVTKVPSVSLPLPEKVEEEPLTA